MKNKIILSLHTVLIAVFFSATMAAQPTGKISGVVINDEGIPVPHIVVLLVQTGETTATEEEGKFSFFSVEPGVYDLFAEAASYTSRVKSVSVRAGETAETEMMLNLSPIRETVTVTARGRHETTFQAVQSVNSLETFDITEKMASSIGEVLDGEPGVAKRSFGPGNSRPVIRGFDGDRVLVLQDGMRTGSIGSQSGDHGEPIDPGNLESMEVVKGPATLLYGSNAIGGVVNAISRHHEIHQHRHEGTRGQITSGFGSNNGLAGANAHVEYGTGNWMFWGGGGGQRTGDYSSPEGTVKNSKSRVTNGKLGLGWYSDSFYLSGSYGIVDGRYGIPFATEFHGHGHDEEDHEVDEDHEQEEEIENVDIAWTSHNLRVNSGFHFNNPAIKDLRLNLSYTDWQHDELEIFPGGTEMTGTAFENRQLTWRADADHSAGRLTGTIGTWGTTRDYQATGEEALSPPVDQEGIALYALEELNYERLKFQFGARVEHTRYSPQGPVERILHDHEEGEEHQEGDEELELVSLPDRSFTGFSGSAGLRAGLWQDGAFVAHVTSSFRAPSLEELYNYGPHVGNLAFEIGNPALRGERSNGFELSLRHAGDRVRAESNYFYYHINDFIFGAPTGELEDGLFVLEYEQGDSRFTGIEFGLDFGLNDYIWLNTGLDMVDAQMTETETPLPRIPPLRGRFGVDLRWKGLSVKPEVVLAARQDQVFSTETETAGYGVVNLKAAYTHPGLHSVHHFAFEVFNIGDNLYRNHVSFIKELAPEIGRGVRISWAVKFF